MATINISKRASGGLTVIIGSETRYISNLKYFAKDDTIYLISTEQSMVFTTVGALYSDFTIASVVPATLLAACNALDAIGLVEVSDTDVVAALEDVELSVDELKATQTDGSQKTQVINADGLDATGICDGYAAVTPNDSADLDNAGWIECRTAAGTMAFVDNKGASGTITLSLYETTKFRVRRVLSSGTSATGLVVYY